MGLTDIIVIFFKRFLKVSSLLFIILTLLSSKAFTEDTFVTAYSTNYNSSSVTAAEFNADGTKMFTIDHNLQNIHEYSLSTGFDLTSTIVLEESYNVGTAVSNLVRGYALAFNSDGTKMFFIDANGTETIHEFTLSTGFDLSTVSYGNVSLDISSKVNVPSGLAFNSDGTKMIVMDYADRDAHTYTLSTGFDLSSTIAHVNETRFSGDITGDTMPMNIKFNSDGTKLFIAGRASDVISEYTLSTGFDVSTASYVDRAYIYVSGFEDTNISGLSFNSDGTKMFISGQNTDSIAEFSLSSAFDVNDALTLSSSSPADGATGVGADDNIVLTFSEAVDAESGNILIKKSSDDSTVETIDVTGGLVSGSGSTTITINPSSTLDEETSYYITIAATAFDDADGTSYAGISDSTTLNFTTNTAPTLSSSSPSDGATGVGADDNIVLTFSEAVDAESGNILIKKSSDDSTVETIDVTGGLVSGSGSTTITINPSTTLDEETSYYITIAATAFDDADSASYAGFSNSTTLNFTTENSTTDPLTDKDVVGSIEAQAEAPKRILQHVRTPVINRMDWLRRHRKENNLTNQNIKFQFSNAMLASLSKVIPASIDVNEVSKLSDTWSLWSEGSISVGKIGDTSSSSSKDIDSNGITIGMDKKIDENKMYGYALRFGRDEVEVGTSGTSLDTNSYSLSLYGTFPHEDTKFIDTVLGVSSLKTDHVRKSGSNTLTGERNGRQVFGSINFRTTYNKDKFNITPNGRIDLGYTELSEYSEIGTDALIYDKQQIETGMVSIGIRLDDTIQFNQITFKPSGLLEYGANFSPSSDATVSYVSDPSTDYTLSIAHEETHNIRAGLGFDIVTENGLTIMANYERDQSDNSHSDTLYLGISYISNRETEYAMILDNDKASFDYKKNLNGFDIKVSSNYSLMSEIQDYGANLEISNKF